MDNVVCDRCSTPLPVGSKFCGECGTPIPGLAGARYANGFPTDLRQALQMATTGEYEVHHELGRGGMGSVFLAREVGLDRLVAIKVLPPNLMFDEGLIERFKREARMVAKLHHPNIIPVYRVHHSQNLAFYTMHFVPGRSLAEMGPNRIPSLQEVERTLLEAAAGLGYAHKRGVIHRDVKPANILIDAEGHVHLTDFGIAKALVGSTHLTETGAVIGTPQYMAPEQCEGRMVDGRADQYSLAAVGYQLLTGQPVFVSDSMKELLYHHLFTPPRPLNAVRPETPLPLRDAIHKALSKDPSDRFDSMEDFRLAVEGKGPPVYVPWLDEKGDRRVNTPQPGEHPFRRSSDPPTTEKLAIANGRERDRPEASGGRFHRYAMGALAVAVVAISVGAVYAITQGVGFEGSWRDRFGAGVATELTSDGESGEALNPAEPGGEVLAPGVNGAAAIPETGRLTITGDLPQGARLEIAGAGIDELIGDNREFDVTPGAQTISISAAGFNTFTRDVDIEAGENAILEVMLEEVPAPRSTPERVVDSRPLVPADLLARLDSLMQQGDVLLFTTYRYYDAAELYRQIERLATDAIIDYRNTDTLEAMLTSVREKIDKAKEFCRRDDQTRCP
jgi:serine/threonine protein kinase